MLFNSNSTRLNSSGMASGSDHMDMNAVTGPVSVINGEVDA
jgi:hypothetical protein